MGFWGGFRVLLGGVGFRASKLRVEGPRVIALGAEGLRAKCFRVGSTGDLMSNSKYDPLGLQGLWNRFSELKATT